MSNTAYAKGFGFGLAFDAGYTFRDNPQNATIQVIAPNGSVVEEHGYLGITGREHLKKRAQAQVDKLNSGK